MENEEKYKQVEDIIHKAMDDISNIGEFNALLFCVSLPAEQEEQHRTIVSVDAKDDEALFNLVHSLREDSEFDNAVKASNDIFRKESLKRVLEAMLEVSQQEGTPSEQPSTESNTETPANHDESN